MNKIKTYKLFLENSNPEIDIFSSHVELYHIGDSIWAIKSFDAHTRALIFIRSQEYYESIFDEIVGKQFKMSRYIDIYRQHYGKKEFTYGTDWAGFNIPSYILEDCMFNIPKDEINNWDKLMLLIIDKIKKVEGSNKYYLLGIDELSNDLLEHEFAHAMYYILPEYKLEMDRLTNECDSKVRDSMYRCIIDYGYADHVLSDEMQAYMATGLGSDMEEANIPDINKYMVKYRSVFQKFYKKTLYSKPNKVELGW